MNKKLLSATAFMLFFNVHGLAAMLKPISRTYDEAATEKLRNLIIIEPLPVDLKQVRALLEEGANPNAQEQKKTPTLLHLAILRNI